MTDPKKTLTRSQYLTALALYTCAQEHERQAGAFVKELATLFGCEDLHAGGLGWINDGIWGYDLSFDEALRRSGFEIPDLTMPDPSTNDTVKLERIAAIASDGLNATGSDHGRGAVAWRDALQAIQAVIEHKLTNLEGEQ